MYIFYTAITGVSFISYVLSCISEIFLRIRVLILTVWILLDVRVS